MGTQSLRQWVFTFPFQLRGRLGFDGKLLGAVTRIFVDSTIAHSLSVASSARLVAAFQPSEPVGAFRARSAASRSFFPRLRELGLARDVLFDGVHGSGDAK